ncbi:MAG: pilus assembly protein FimV [Gammaproteobacteria bacterium]|jgi:pilus assembly protein FimV
MKNQFHFYVFCLVIACVVTPVQGLTLNNIELNSYLNQILDARIGLDGVKSGDIDELNLQVLDSAITTNQLLSVLILEVKDDGKGHYIHVTSRDSIREPILSFTLEITWAEGHLIRDYTVLMDPKK